MLRPLFIQFWKIKLGLKLDEKYSTLWDPEFVFLRRGETEACLRQSGTLPELRHLLMTDNNSGPISISLFKKMCGNHIMRARHNLNVIVSPM